MVTTSSRHRAASSTGSVALSTPQPVDTPLDPTRLTPHAESAMGALLAEGESENTVRSYQTAVRYWAAWFELRFGQPIALPVPVAAVMQFIVDHAERKSGTALVCELPEAVDRALVEGGHKAAPGAPALSTLVHRISVLSKAHQLAGQANPCLDAKVRELMSRTRRAYARRGVVQDKKAALTREPLQALLDTCDDSLRGVRDRALILFAWSSGGRRRSEVTSATLDKVRKVADRTWVYALHHSKTNQAGWANRATDKPIVGPAADALETWLARSGIREGAIFRRIRKGGQVAEPLSAAAVRDIIKARSLLAGLPDEYSAHSLRSGFVTEAARQQVSIGETMALTGHASVASVVGYFRTAAATDSKAARLLEEEQLTPAGERVPPGTRP
jgi:integrase